jgi:hypothetical protein
VLQSSQAPARSHTPEKKNRPKRERPLRLNRLHPPLVQTMPYLRSRAAVTARPVALSNIRITASGSSRLLPGPLVLPLALIALVGAVFIGLAVVPQRLMGGAPEGLMDHRAELAVAGLSIALGLAIGVLTPLLLS